MRGSRIGDYRIERELASEETGVVYLGIHAVLPRHAAVKVMHGGEGQPVAVQMLREACLLEALAHPGIPRVFECGRLPDRRPWTAFERVAGVPIAELIAKRPLPLADLVLVLRDVGDLLAHAHARGVVHRRISAAAILRTADRGSSVCVQQWADAITIDSGHGEPGDDVRALGGVAYRALTGQLHADPGTRTELASPAAPQELTALIDQMLGDAPPPAEEVRDRARWLADSFEPHAFDRARWTPPMGVRSESIPVVGVDEPSGFTIRIGRPTKS